MRTPNILFSGLALLLLVGAAPDPEPAGGRYKLTPVEDGAFLRALADAIARGGTFGDNRSRWVIESFSAAPLVLPATAEIRVGSVEQSNTSTSCNDAQHSS